MVPIICFGLTPGNNYVSYIYEEGYGVKRHFQQYFSCIVPVNFISGVNWSTLRKPQTCRKSLTNFITYYCIEHTSPWTGFALTTLVVIDTDCIGSYKSNYHTITTMTTSQYCSRISIIDCCWTTSNHYVSCIYEQTNKLINNRSCR